jgi:hypothetical protein
MFVYFYKKEQIRLERNCISYWSRSYKREENIILFRICKAVNWSIHEMFENKFPVNKSK